MALDRLSLLDARIVEQQGAWLVLTPVYPVNIGHVRL